MGVRCVLAVAGIFVFSWMTAGAYAAGADRLFEELREGQSVRVAVSCKRCIVGCLVNLSYEFVFRRAPTLAVTIKTGNSTLGTVNVTDDEAAGLDRLLQYYRAQPKDAYLKAVDNITVTLLNGEKALSTEGFGDLEGRTFYIEGLTLFSDFMDKLQGRPKRKVMPDPKLEAEENARKAMAASQQLAGYDRFLKSFKIFRASIDYYGEPTNGESLFVRIETTQPAFIDAVWWDNLLVNGRPSLSWDDFMKSYAAVEAAMSKHPWLQEWKNLKGRSLELHLTCKSSGNEIGDLETFVIPLWRHAGFAGEPAYYFRAHYNNGRDWIDIYFSDKDDRALVTVNSNPDPESPSMMERADVYWHPRGEAGEKYSRYAIIENDGSCHVETFVGDEAKK